ncbi:glycine/sarcosine/betaine reductase component B subunit, partial [Treponema pedis]|uniref:glycine/sarcosine/betaine reductase component B subunit n=1 Tax=Treponema pedis TaxID=409322 RepID=UPI0021F2D20F
MVELENLGIKTVGISNECVGRDGASQPLVVLDEKANALVSTGDVSDLIELPPAEKVIGELEALGRDGLSGAGLMMKYWARRFGKTAQYLWKITQC